eukprot:SAG22_NODE_341_length_11992_cov_180.308753_9_plen_45_part_00
MGCSVSRELGDSVKLKTKAGVKVRAAPCRVPCACPEIADCSLYI